MRNAPGFSRGHFTAQLTTWFQAARRNLPWREASNARDAYRVLVSEVMLQQTTVAAVIPFYLRFLERFPTLESLARASIEEVLPMWAGLGYYSRARNLHATAHVVMEKHGGVFPQTLEEVLALPGVGRYTAGAVLSIAFDRKIPIVDANVARVLSRVLCLEGDLKNSATQKRLWDEAGKLVEASTHAAQFNPAMMELGALVCVPKNPRCEVCPVSRFCCAFKTHRQNELPFVAPKRKSIELNDVCAFATRDNRVLLRRRSDQAGNKNWWRGMWELPRATRGEGESTHEALQRLFEDELNVSVEIGEKLRTVTHGVTHHKIALDCFAVHIESFTARQDWKYFDWQEVESLALPSVMRRLLRWLSTHVVENAQLSLL
jgi:A/G-specific adenine glycosylase